MVYAILFHPGHNRVYFETSLKLALSEFRIVAQNFAVRCSSISQQTLWGAEYLVFETVGDLTTSDIAMIGDLSFVYALFQWEQVDGKTYFVPIDRTGDRFVDEGISAMLKYTGKTNEIFTRMMVNVAYYSQENRGEVRLLDPIAGKGTTLYEGMIKGFHVCGIEIGDKVVHETFHFLKKYLENAKYKFDCKSIRISGPNKSFTAIRHTFAIARTKEAYKNRDVRSVELVAGNSMYADKYYKKNTFDMIVGDLPYGVQHGNVTNEKQSSLTRNPAELLNACLPAWREVLKPGGTLVLAWNCNVLPRAKFTEALEAKGFEVLKEEPYLQFEHRVDQAILRDVIVANKVGRTPIKQA